LNLGEQIVELTQYVSPATGRPLPVPSFSNDAWFQHMAIVVDDMDAESSAPRSPLSGQDGAEPIADASRGKPDPGVERADACEDGWIALTDCCPRTFALYVPSSKNHSKKMNFLPRPSCALVSLNDVQPASHGRTKPTNRSGSQLRFSALSSYAPVDSLAR
jgi:hypothetical protein